MRLGHTQAGTCAARRGVDPTHAFWHSEARPAAAGRAAAVSCPAAHLHGQRWHHHPDGAALWQVLQPPTDCATSNLKPKSPELVEDVCQITLRHFNYLVYALLRHHKGDALAAPPLSAATAAAAAGPLCTCCRLDGDLHIPSLRPTAAKRLAAARRLEKVLPEAAVQRKAPASEAHSVGRVLCSGKSGEAGSRLMLLRRSGSSTAAVPAAPPRVRISRWHGCFPAWDRRTVPCDGRVRIKELW